MLFIVMYTINYVNCFVFVCVFFWGVFALVHDEIHDL